METSPFHVLRVEKWIKGDSISFRFDTSVKGQALGDPFKFRESEKIKLLLRNTRQRVYQITVNCNIHLGFNNEKEINQGLSVRAGNLPECSVRCITGIGRQTRLPMDKGLKPSGVSLYILDGTGSTSPY